MLKLISDIQAWRKERRRLKKFQKAQAESGQYDVQGAFEQIYKENKWGAAPDGSGFWSGNGSKASFAAAYVEFMVDFLNAHSEYRTLVDIGCGDFRVSKSILEQLPNPPNYIGCDIVPDLIAHHNEHHAKDGVSFRHVNAVDEDPPAGDVATIRQILQHLSNAQVAGILERAKRLYKVVIITESLPKECKAPNLDIGHGIATRVALGSGVYIDEPPYSLPIADHFDVDHSVNEIMRTWIVRFD
ncbi:MAG: class I SAM-dependent methyltransferase [Alphaproteobacteria bacterium]|nr:class I SAM-dependent methyltransferase [Alphaproteobacteria bacterium]